MSIGTTNSYDELPYVAICFPETHPDYLATLGRIFGIDTPSVPTCRVLELGCACGGNLIPMAMELPDARFIGVDLSSRQVEAGKSTIESLGIDNIELRAMNIVDVDEQFGSFDYIVCHGVYSWVPEAVREKILAICSARLKPNGVAYVSYNTYPGWHARGMVREMMSYHVKGTVSAMDRVAKAREFIENLVAALPGSSSAYAQNIQAEGELLRGVANSYLYHEHLEETNHPVYFFEFAGRAAAHGLDFVTEARVSGLLDTLPPDSRALVAHWAGDRLAAEQYLDYLTNRTFRRSLLCRADCPRPGGPSAEEIANLWVSSNIIPVSTEPNVTSDAPEEFRRPVGASGITTNSPVLKAALLAIHENHHHPLTFAALRGRIASMLGVALGDDDVEVLRQSLLRCYLSNLVELHVSPPRFAIEPSVRPATSPLARLQVLEGQQVTNQRRKTMEVVDFERLVIRLLDGTRDEAAVLEAILGMVQAGEFTLHRDGRPMTDLDELRALLEPEVGPCLRRLAAMALLVA